MYNLKYILIFQFFICCLSVVYGQHNQHNNSLGNFEFNDSFRGESAIRVMFYNVENLFDTEDDSLKNDESFTPKGEHHWNSFKYNQKLVNLSKTILAVGGWEAVEIVGLCEVENRKVVEELIVQTALAPAQYSIIHKESPDIRGIDVALLYREEKLTLDTVQFLQVFLGKSQRPTRYVLYAIFTTLNESRLHVFVNHWPSRYGGQMKSDPKRKAAARVVRQVVDSILSEDSKANVLLMGDFNDEPENTSVREVLRAGSDTTFSDTTALYNLMSTVHGSRGSYKYQGSWGVLDQFMVSKSLFKGQSGLQVKPGALIFRADFLLIDETKYPGQKPFRTFNGMKYEGGYSDHLPVFIDLQILN